MQTAIIVSTKDLAGMNIKSCLLELFNPKSCGKYSNHEVYDLGKAKLYTTDNDSINCENIDDEIAADLFIFATKHQSAAGINSLSTHVPGNWGNADYGGKPKELCVCPANHLKETLKKLEELNNLGFEVVQECTHHGPFMKRPCMFIEIGSNETAWKKKEAGIIIAKAIHHLINSEIKQFRTAVGIGGLHTTPSFKKIMLKEDIAVGHVCPKYNLENLDEEMIKQALERTVPKADLIILDWKGMKEHKERIKEMVSKLNVEVVRTDKY